MKSNLTGIVRKSLISDLITKIPEKFDSYLSSYVVLDENENPEIPVHRQIFDAKEFKDNPERVYVLDVQQFPIGESYLERKFKKIRLTLRLYDVYGNEDSKEDTKHWIFQISNQFGNSLDIFKAQLGIKSVTFVISTNIQSNTVYNYVTQSFEWDIILF